MKLTTKFILFTLMSILPQVAYSMTLQELLFEYAKANKAQELEQLLKANIDLDINTQNEYGWTPLYCAAIYNSLEAATALLDNDASTETCTRSGSTPLYIAVAKNHIEIVKLLLERHARVNTQEASGATPLHKAAENNYTDLITLLLAKGANTNIQNSYGYTPLHCAVMAGHKEAISLLFDDIFLNTSLRDAFNQTALDRIRYLSQDKYQTEIYITVLVRQQENKKLLRFLFFAIKLALKYNHPEIFADLLKNNCNIALALREAETGNTILHLAAQTQNAHLVEIALEYLPELINITNKQNQKPLEFKQEELSAKQTYPDKESKEFLPVLFCALKLTLENNNTHAFEKLIQNNRSIALALREAQTGNTILHLAMLKRNLELVKLVLKYLPELISIENNQHKKPLELENKNFRLPQVLSVFKRAALAA